MFWQPPVSFCPTFLVTQKGGSGKLARRACAETFASLFKEDGLVLRQKNNTINPMGAQLGDILQDRNYSEPPEIQLIKEFVKNEVGIVPTVKVTPDTLIVTLPSAAAAGTLRFKLFQLQRQLGHTRKIILKIS